MSPDVDVDLEISGLTLANERFNEVFSHTPRGAVLLTTPGNGSGSRSILVGSFTQVRADTPTAAVTVGRDFPLERGSAICLNLLSEDQLLVFRDHQSGHERILDRPGVPVLGGGEALPGAAAWFAGVVRQRIPLDADDLLVVAIHELDSPSPENPLLQLHGGVGGFGSLTSVRSEDHPVALGGQLDSVRPHLERAAVSTGREVIALARVGDGLGIVASAGAPSPTTVVGRRFPFVPPYGSVFLAHALPDEIESRLASESGSVTAEDRELFRASLKRVHERGWSVALTDHDHPHVDRLIEAYTRGPVTPALRRRLETAIAGMARSYDPPDSQIEIAESVRMISVGVWGHQPEPVLQIGVHALNRPVDVEVLPALREALLNAAADMRQVLIASENTPSAPQPRQESSR